MKNYDGFNLSDNAQQTIPSTSGWYIPPGYNLPGYVPAFKGPMHMGIQASLATIMVVLVALRMYCRIFLVGVFRLDDGLLLLAVCVVIVQVVSHGFGYYKAGIGYHLVDSMVVSGARGHQGALYGWISVLLQILSTALTRLSILIYIARIVADTRSKFALWGMAVVSGIFGIIAFFVNMLQCRPISSFWTEAIRMDVQGVKGICLNKVTVLYMTVLGNLSLNALVCILAGHSLWLIQRQLRRKEGYVLIFCLILGVSVLTNSAIRVSETAKITTTRDPTWVGADLCLMAALEPLIGVIAAAIPSLNPLMAAVFPAFWGATSEPTPPRNFGVKKLKGTEQFRVETAYANHVEIEPLYIMDAASTGNIGIVVKRDFDQARTVETESSVRRPWRFWKVWIHQSAIAYNS